MNLVIQEWKRSLNTLLVFYDKRRPRIGKFLIFLFPFFVLLNIVCYWWAMVTAFPSLLTGSSGVYYFKVQFPVGFLGALFDSLSFFVTIYIIRRALEANSTKSYIGHLSVDLLIAALATCWVLFVFSISGWLVGFTGSAQPNLSERNQLYQQMAVDALSHPMDNLRNIYFGIIMGISAALPTTIHLYMSIRSIMKVKFRFNTG
jgi:hypothetical protein